MRDDSISLENGLDTASCPGEMVKLYQEVRTSYETNEYKHKSGRMFPTWSEVLEVLRALGYEKIPDASAAG